VERQQQLQQRSLAVMQTLLAQAEANGQEACFFLHLAPNLGNSGGVEVLKPAAPGNVGTTDVQFMLRGAVKEAGLLALINQHIARRTGTAPLGEVFNARSAPADHAQLLELCQRSIPVEQMPVLVGVGDTITSEPDGEGGWRRGGSDRGFLTLLQELGHPFGRSNRVVLVDSSAGEVDRPSLQDPELKGLSDPEDPLKPDVLVPGGPDAYVAWFEQLATELGA
jgi:glucosylglycerol 3-phosphatase